MSDPFSWIGAGLSAGGNLLGNIFGGQATDRASKRAYRLGEKNLALQAEEQAYQRQFAAEGRLREDNAVQRRAADMAAAGFNPLLAAGSPAASGVTSGSSAPRMDAGDAFRLQAEAGRQRGQAIAKAGMFPEQILSQEMMRAQIDKTKAEADYQKALIPGAAGKQQSETDLNVTNALVQKANNIFSISQLEAIKKDASRYYEAGYRELATSEAKQKYRLDYESARMNASQALAKAGIDKEVADAISAVYASEMAASDSEVSKATVPSRIAGSYTGVVGSLAGSVRDVGFNTWLTNYLKKAK